MPHLELDTEQFKALVKEALLEIIEERQDLFITLFDDVAQQIIDDKLNAHEPDFDALPRFPGIIGEA